MESLGQLESDASRLRDELEKNIQHATGHFKRHLQRAHLHARHLHTALSEAIEAENTLHPEV